jgi:hypothetical protein
MQTAGDDSWIDTQKCIHGVVGAFTVDDREKSGGELRDCLIKRGVPKLHEPRCQNRRSVLDASLRDGRREGVENIPDLWLVPQRCRGVCVESVDKLAESVSPELMIHDGEASHCVRGMLGRNATAPG